MYGPTAKLISRSPCNIPVVSLYVRLFVCYVSVAEVCSPMRSARSPFDAATTPMTLELPSEFTTERGRMGITEEGVYGKMEKYMNY